MPPDRRDLQRTADTRRHHGSPLAHRTSFHQQLERQCQAASGDPAVPLMPHWFARRRRSRRGKRPRQPIRQSLQPQIGLRCTRHRVPQCGLGRQHQPLSKDFLTFGPHCWQQPHSPPEGLSRSSGSSARASQPWRLDSPFRNPGCCGCLQIGMNRSTGRRPRQRQDCDDHRRATSAADTEHGLCPGTRRPSRA